MADAARALPVDEQTRVEELVEACPEAVKVLLREGVRCIRCGEPVWGTLGDLMKESGVPDPEATLKRVNEACGKVSGS